MSLWLCVTHPGIGVGRRPPSLAFEVVSPGNEARGRHYVTKIAEYLAYGLGQYGIVDPQTKCVTVVIRDGDAWVEQVYRDDQQARSLGPARLRGQRVRPVAQRRGRSTRLGNGEWRFLIRPLGRGD